MERFYTIAEANAMLPVLTPLLEKMRARGGELTGVRLREAEVEKKVRGNGYHNPTEDGMSSNMTQQLAGALREDMAQLEEWGIELKDLAAGLIDFPAIRQGRTVFLCWRLGESEVAFWHETTTGFEGRQPIDDLLA